MIEIWNLVIQAGLLLVGVAAILLPYLESQRKKQVAAIRAIADDLRSQLSEAQRRHDKEVSELKAALVAEREDRVEKTARIHARIDDMQKDLIGKVLSDMSEIKGDLRGLSNIIRPIQEWFINQNKLNQNGG